MSIAKPPVLAGSRARAARGQPRPTLAELYDRLADAREDLDELEQLADDAANAGRMDRWALHQKRADVIRAEIGRIQVDIDWAQSTAHLSPQLPSRTASQAVER